VWSFGVVSCRVFGCVTCFLFTGDRFVKCLWEVFVWGFGVLFLLCACVCRCRGCCSLSVCVCVCDLFLVNRGSVKDITSSSFPTQTPTALPLLTASYREKKTCRFHRFGGGRVLTTSREQRCRM